MKRFLAPIIAILISALAITGSWGVAFFTPPPFVNSTPTYNGPGDVVTGWSAWYGLRAYNAAYATGSNYAVALRRISDGQVCNFTIASNGGFGPTDGTTYGAGTCTAGAGESAATFAGTDATCTGTASASTTLALTGCSSTPHVGDTLTATGGTGSFTNPVVIVSVGGFAGGAGNVTLQAAQTVTSVAVTAQVALAVAVAYDQSNALDCSGLACNVSQGTTADQPFFVPNCDGTLPCIYENTDSQILTTGVAFGGTNAQPGSASMVFERLGNTQGTSLIFTTHNTQIQSPSTSNTVLIYAGTSATATANDGALHALQGVFHGTTSSLNVDGTDSGNISAGTGTLAGTLNWLSDGVGDSVFGYHFEMGVIVGTALTSTQRGNMCHNQYLYYTTAASC